MVLRRPASAQPTFGGDDAKLRLLVTHFAASIGVVIAFSSGAHGSTRVDELWSRAYLAISNGGGVHELAALGAACSQQKRRKRIDALHTAECLRWVGEQQLALDQIDAAEASLTSAHELYSKFLGAINPLSGEVLHLMAEIYLERGDLRRAGLAMDRALEVLVPVRRRMAERCLRVYAAIGTRTPPEQCAQPLYLFPSLTTPLEEIKNDSTTDVCPSDPCRLKFETRQWSEEREHRGFHFSGTRSGYGLEIGDGGNSIWSGVYRGDSLNGYAVYVGLSEAAVEHYYAGGWKDGRRHGFGSFRYANGDAYTGEFRDGVEHGEGEFVSSTGTRFSGSIVGAKLDGEGKLIVPGLLRSEGIWSQGNREGPGFDSYLDGLIEYRGEYEKNQPKGRGRVFVQGREVSAGEFDPKVGPGFGIVKLADGTTYVGQLRDGRPNGFGIQKTNDQNVITGIWVDAQRVRDWNDDDFTAIAEVD